MSGQPAWLAQSYRVCEREARRAGSNFYPAFCLLSPDKRRAMCALYAFLRHTDDLGDNAGPVAPRREALARWRSRLEAALAGSLDRPSAPHLTCEAGRDQLGACVLLALADTVQQFRIPAQHLYAVLDGVAMDLDGRRYETFAELEEYCHAVASAVGLACIHIWGFRSKAAFEPARQCGVAYQLTNILRDLGEDAASGRVYLPLKELRQCEYSIDDLLARRVDQRFHRLMDLQIARARRYYEGSASLGDHLEPQGRRILGMMTATYRGLLDEIDRRRADVFSRKISLGRWQKLRIAARWHLWPPKEPLG